MELITIVTWHDLNIYMYLTITSHIGWMMGFKLQEASSLGFVYYLAQNSNTRTFVSSRKILRQFCITLIEFGLTVGILSTSWPRTSPDTISSSSIHFRVSRLVHVQKKEQQGFARLTASCFLNRVSVRNYFFNSFRKLCSDSSSSCPCIGSVTQATCNPLSVHYVLMNKYL